MEKHPDHSHSSPVVVVVVVAVVFVVTSALGPSMLSKTASSGRPEKVGDSKK
jgi:hypothetical protein